MTLSAYCRRGRRIHARRARRAMFLPRFLDADAHAWQLLLLPHAHYAARQRKKRSYDLLMLTHTICLLMRGDIALDGPDDNTFRKFYRVRRRSGILPRYGC